MINNVKRTQIFKAKSNLFRETNNPN